MGAHPDGASWSLGTSGPGRARTPLLHLRSRLVPSPSLSAAADTVRPGLITCTPCPLLFITPGAKWRDVATRAWMSPWGGGREGAGVVRASQHISVCSGIAVAGRSVAHAVGCSLGIRVNARRQLGYRLRKAGRGAGAVRQPRLAAGICRQGAGGCLGYPLSNKATFAAAGGARGLASNTPCSRA